MLILLNGKICPLVFLGISKLATTYDLLISVVQVKTITPIYKLVRSCFYKRHVYCSPCLRALCGA
jgi:hypothetical protein